MRGAVSSHDWTGVVPELHGFCNNDLSAFYFDVRKDALYCDGPDSHRRRSVSTVLDLLHRHLCAWFAPVLAFTAEEAWLARFGGEEESVHLRDFPAVPAGWRDEALAGRWATIREARRAVTGVLETARAAGEIGSSLQAAPVLRLPPSLAGLLDEVAWAEVCITSGVTVSPDGPEGGGFAAEFAPATGAKCARCWRVLPEVGESAAHPALCFRCEAVVEAQERDRAAAAA